MSKEKTPDRSPPSTNKTRGRKKTTTKKKSTVKGTGKSTAKKSTTKRTRKPQERCKNCGKTKRYCKCGRPPKIDLSIVQNLSDMFRIDATITEACAQAGISTSTYYNRIDAKATFLDKLGKEKSFEKEMNKSQSFAFIAAKKTLVRAAASGDTKAATEFLKRRHSDYKDKQEHTGKDGAPLFDTITITPHVPTTD